MREDKTHLTHFPFPAESAFSISDRILRRCCMLMAMTVIMAMVVMLCHMLVPNPLVGHLFKATIPCKNVTLRMFNPNPMQPIMSMSFGFSTPKAHEQEHLRRKGRPTTRCNKALYRLQKYANPKPQEKDPVEEGA